MNLYQTSQGKQSARTKAKQKERNRNRLFYDSANQWDENPHLDKPRRLPYVNHEKKAARQAELKANKKGLIGYLLGMINDIRRKLSA